MVGAVPLDYRCYKCHQSGHWVSMCPLNQVSGLLLLLLNWALTYHKAASTKFILLNSSLFVLYIGHNCCLKLLLHCIIWLHASCCLFQPRLLNCNAWSINLSIHLLICLFQQDLRKSTDIPSRFLVEISDPSIPGVMIDSSGKFVRLLDMWVYFFFFFFLPLFLFIFFFFH